MSENKNHKKQDSPNVAYLKAMGLTNVTEETLRAPEIGKFGHKMSNDWEWSGNINPNFEYYRATDDRSVKDAESLGFIRLPSDCGIRMLGVHTKDEIIMARTTEAGEAYRAAQRQRVQSEATGTLDHQTPLGGGIYSNERIGRTLGASPV